MMPLTISAAVSERFLPMADQKRKMQDLAFSFVHNGATCKGLAIILEMDRQGFPSLIDFIINSRFAGTARLDSESWKIESAKDSALVQKALHAASMQLHTPDSFTVAA